jgi:hypothetical protein
MDGDRLLRILAELSSGGVTEPGAARLCEVCASVSLMSGAGVMLMVGEVQGSLCSSNPVSALIEELQYTHKEGPCIDAFERDEPVLEPDLADSATDRWFAFTPAAVEAGARAVFGFPLQVGTVRLGALDVYRDRSGPLTEDQNANLLVLSGVVARAVLVMQAHGSFDEIGGELEMEANFRFVVYQAVGMVCEQLGVSVADATARLRAYAFGNDRLLTDVANDVVNQQLRFDGQASV